MTLDWDSKARISTHHQHWFNPVSFMFFSRKLLTYPNQKGAFLRTISQHAFDWFLIHMDAVSIFKYYLCATNCAPGNASVTHVLRSIHQAVELIRRVQPNPDGWEPENGTLCCRNRADADPFLVEINVRNKLCRTTLSDPHFCLVLKAEVILIAVFSYIILTVSIRFQSCRRHFLNKHTDAHRNYWYPLSNSSTTLHTPASYYSLDLTTLTLRCSGQRQMETYGTIGVAFECFTVKSSEVTDLRR